MSDVDHDPNSEFDEAFKDFGSDPKPTPPPEPPKTDPPAPAPAAPGTPPVAPPEPPKQDPPKPGEEPKKDDEQPPAEPPKKEEPGTPPASDEKKTEEGAPPAKTPETPPETPAAAEEPKPLTKDDLAAAIRDVQTEQRTSTQALEATTNEVIEKYYPDGLSNVLVDKNTGKELRTPADVVEVTDGKMSIEEAGQWLINEQFRLDKEVAEIKDRAKTIAETTLKFKQDSQYVMQRYEPLFKAYPQVQQKVWDRYIKQVKADKEKGVVLSAPDMQEYYDDFLEPYQQAYEFATKQSATNPTPPPADPANPPAATPGADDRLDENGDGGPAPVDDPNDFAQQVTKELAKGA